MADFYCNPVKASRKGDRGGDRIQTPGFFPTRTELIKAMAGFSEML